MTNSFGHRLPPIGNAERRATPAFPRGQTPKNVFIAMPYTCYATEARWAVGGVGLTCPKELCPLYGSLSIAVKSARSWEAERPSPCAKKFKVPPSRHGADETPNINSRGEKLSMKKKKQPFPFPFSYMSTFGSSSHGHGTPTPTPRL